MVKMNPKATTEPDAFQAGLHYVLSLFQARKKQFYVGLGVLLCCVLIAVGWYIYRQDYEKSAQRLYDVAFGIYQSSPPGKEGYLRAIARYREVVEKYPGSKAAANALFSMGNLYYRLQDTDQAIRAYEDFLNASGRKDDLRSLAYNGLAYSYEEKGELQKALEAYENSLKTPLGSAFIGVTYSNMGRIYIEMKDKKKALENFRKAKEQKNDPVMDALISRKIAELES